jgi:hypothetical protein
MSRKNSDGDTKASFSPVQRRACIVLACCALALILTIGGVIFAFGGLSFGKDSYNPQAYPVDTSLGSVLTQSSEADSSYTSQTVFIGDQNTVDLCDLGLITLDQYVGKDGMKSSGVVSDQCVYFADDANAYTIPQAIAKMKPRRIIVTLGTNDAAAGTDADSFIQNYKQALKAISTAYSYSDIIVNAVPPVPKGYSLTASAQQTLTDQYNQALASMCNEESYKFLNSAELLKDTATGYAQISYFDAQEWNKTGANTFLQYVRSHAYTSDDRRPDTNDIPKRAAQAAASAATEASPTATPTSLKANYAVEQGKGTLTGNGQTNVASLEFTVDEKTSLSVTAVAADGYSFYKWSDGITTATRYDSGFKQDLSVTAMFNDARVAIALDKGDTTLNIGDTLTVNASVKLGDKSYDNSGVQWSLNDELQATAGSYTFSAAQAGTYTIKAGIEINGTFQSAQLVVTVNGPTTTVSITGPTSLTAGSSTTLSAQVNNGNGDITWSCDQKPDWSAAGTQVQFTAGAVGDYIIKAVNNGVTASFTLHVTEAAPVAPTPAVDPNVPTQ